MCTCSPLCEPLDGDWPAETCPNPNCSDPNPIKPVGLHPMPSVAGLTFHCRTCPCRWYSTYEYATEE
ncbi:hypothetical protein [Streptomyces sp. NPDC057910]|uniref:hypothetical protein n=1 Tax=Streptomyces sp. NPDC057910 TaxID=3346278 RepID=UPI0036E77009